MFVISSLLNYCGFVFDVWLIVDWFGTVKTRSKIDPQWNQNQDGSWQGFRVALGADVGANVCPRWAREGPKMGPRGSRHKNPPGFFSRFGDMRPPRAVKEVSKTPRGPSKMSQDGPKCVGLWGVLARLWGALGGSWGALSGSWGHQIRSHQIGSHWIQSHHITSHQIISDHVRPAQITSDQIRSVEAYNWCGKLSPSQFFWIEFGSSQVKPN